MADTDKLVSDLAELRKQAQTLIEGLDSILAAYSPSEVRADEDNSYFIDHVIMLLQGAGQPLKDSEIIASVSKLKGVVEPEVQAWKSLGYWMRPRAKERPIATVEARDGRWVEVPARLRTASMTRLRQFPGNLIALREWVGNPVK